VLAALFFAQNHKIAPSLMPFKFKLDPIKRLREYDEQRERIRLGKEIGILNMLKAQTAELEEKMRVIALNFQESNDATSLQAASQFYSTLNAEMISLQGVIEVQHGVIADARQRHQVARVALRTFERLEERARDKYRQEALKKEQRFLDEIAVIGASR
jgi:flagellar export protein FliJ